MNTSHTRTRMAARCAAVIAATAFAAIGFASPAAAEYVYMPCAAQGDPLQSCDGGVLTRALTQGQDNAGWSIRFTSSDDMCSDIFMQIRAVPNGSPIRVLGRDRIGPGQSTATYQIENTGKGASVELHATGIEGGCNTGSLMGWEGDLQVEEIAYKN
jgi:hypothetical protein